MATLLLNPNRPESTVRVTQEKGKQQKEHVRSFAHNPSLDDEGNLLFLMGLAEQISAVQNGDTEHRALMCPSDKGVEKKGTWYRIGSEQELLARAFDRTLPGKSVFYLRIDGDGVHSRIFYKGELVCNGQIGLSKNEEEASAFLCDRLTDTLCLLTPDHIQIECFDDFGYAVAKGLCNAWKPDRAKKDLHIRDSRSGPSYAEEEAVVRLQEKIFLARQKKKKLDKLRKKGYNERV